MKSLAIAFTCLIFIAVGSNAMGLTLIEIGSKIYEVDKKIEKIEGEIKTLKSRKKIETNKIDGLNRAIQNANVSLISLDKELIYAKDNKMVFDDTEKFRKKIKEKKKELVGLQKALEKVKVEIKDIQRDIDLKNTELDNANTELRILQENQKLCRKQGLKPTDTCPPEKKKIVTMQQWMEILEDKKEDQKKRCTALYHIIKQLRPGLVEEINKGEAYFDVFSLYAVRSLVTLGTMKQLPCRTSPFWIKTVNELEKLTKAVCKVKQQEICLRYILYGEVPPEK